jgi:hypothetical protein
LQVLQIQVVAVAHLVEMEQALVLVKTAVQVLS